MQHPISRARERSRLAPSKVSPGLLAFIRAIGPLYASAALKLEGIELRHGERLVEAWRDFQEGRIRLILAFRHPYGDEPQLFSSLFDLVLPREARKLGRPLNAPAHARFVHGYEVPLWSGALVRWLLPRIGAVPVYHVRFDAESVAALRKILLEDPYPLALAPEGQVSYRSETLPRIESGSARLAFWCAEDLEKAGKTIPVLVLPLSVHYRYDEAGMDKLEAYVLGLERRCGLALRPGLSPAGAEARRLALKARLQSLDLRLISLAEAYYGIPAPQAAPAQTAPQAADREARLERVLEDALERGEAILGLKTPRRGGSAAAPERIGRVYRIRQEGWDRIYPVGGSGRLPGGPEAGGGQLERELADRRAGEAWYAMRHMETVDLAHYLDAAYLEGRPGEGSPSFGRLVECAYSLGDLASRLTGGDFSDRPNFLAKRATIIAAEPIDLGARYQDYRRDRKAAVEAATASLAKAFRDCIEEYLQ